MDSLLESATADEREVALSEFYARWVVQESTRLDNYGEEWRRRNWQVISLRARVLYEKLVYRLMHPLGGRA